MQTTTDEPAAVMQSVEPLTMRNRPLIVIETSTPPTIKSPSYECRRPPISNGNGHDEETDERRRQRDDDSSRLLSPCRQAPWRSASMEVVDEQKQSRT